MNQFSKDLNNLIEICLRLDNFEDIEDEICEFLYKFKLMPGSEIFDETISLIFTSVYSYRTNEIIAKFREMIDEYD